MLHVKIGFNPFNCRSFFSRLWLTCPPAKNQGCHQLIAMEFCMSHYSHKAIPDAEFEFSSSSKFVTKFPSLFSFGQRV